MWDSDDGAWYWEGTCINNASNNCQVGCTTLAPEIKFVDPGIGIPSLEPDTPQSFITAIFKIIDVENDSGTVTNLDKYRCELPLPDPMQDDSGDMGFKVIGPPANDTQAFKKINEVEVSKKLRKSLKQWRKNNL